MDRFARQHRHRIALRQPDVEVMFDNLPNSIEYIKARPMRPIAVTSATHRAERVVAERLLRLAKGSLAWPIIDVDKALPWVAERLGLSLAESQSAAVQLALASKVLVITGGPGVGKTTIVKAILRVLAARGGRLPPPAVQPSA